MPKAFEKTEQIRSQQTIDDVLRAPHRKKLHEWPKLIKQAFVLVWRAAPQQMLTLGVMQLLSGACLAAQLIVIRQLLQRVGGGPAPPPLGTLMPEVVALGLLLATVMTAGVAQREQQRLLTERVSKYTTGRVLDVTTRAELIDFDRPQFHDELERARVNATVRPIQVTQGIVGLLGAVSAALAIWTTLAIIAPYIALLLLVAVLPSFHLNKLAARALHAHAATQTPSDRHRSYLFHVLSRKDEAQEIRVFGSASHLRKQHDDIFDSRIAAVRKLTRRRTYYGVANGLVISVTIVASVILLLTQVRGGTIGLSDAVVAMGAVAILSGRAKSITTTSDSLHEGALFLGDFSEFVSRSTSASRSAEPTCAHSRTTPAPSRPRPASMAVDHELDGSTELEYLVLDNVSFRYPSRAEASLRQVSLSITQGEVIGIVGRNGSGKTTLVKLLAGLYVPTSGEVLWGSERLDDSLQTSRLAHASVVFQDFAKYFMSASGNIGIGCPIHIGDLPRIVAASKAAGAHEFLSNLPDSYCSLLGPTFVGGCDLSYGQWQRVAIARAYFKEARILILDEPTASLDAQGEYEVFLEVRRRVERGHTVVLVSHRFSNVRMADRIVVLDQGEIAEIGSHDALVASGGLYAELLDIQSRAAMRGSDPSPTC